MNVATRSEKTADSASYDLNCELTCIFTDALLLPNAEMTSTWNQVTELRNSKKNNDEEISELKAQVTSLQKKATKGSDLNSKLLALMSQVLALPSEVV